MPTLPGIYKWTNKLNGKVYIGKSINLRKRCHKYLYKINKITTIKKEDRVFDMLFDKALVKYGFENFSVETLECYPLRSEFIETYILRREEFWISFYNSTNKTIGYNLLSGDRGLGHGLSEESKKKISVANSGKNNGMFGEISSRRIKICKVSTIDFSTLNIYDSISDAGERNKLNISHLSDALKGKRIKVGGYFWDEFIPSEADEDAIKRRNSYFTKRLTKKKQFHSPERRVKNSLARIGVRQKGCKLTKVNQIDPISNIVIRTFNAIIDAEKYFKPNCVRAIKISNHLRGLTCLAYGFKWEKVKV